MPTDDDLERGEIPIDEANSAFEILLDCLKADGKTIDRKSESIGEASGVLPLNLKNWWGQGRRGRRFERYRDQLLIKGFASVTLAKILMVEKPTFSNWESKRKTPSCEIDLLLERFVFEQSYKETPKDLQCDDIYGYLNAITLCRESYISLNRAEKLKSKTLSMGEFWMLFELSKIIGTGEARTVLSDQKLMLLVHYVNNRARNYGGEEFLRGLSLTPAEAKKAVQDLLETWGVFWVFVICGLPSLCWTRIS